MHLLLTLGALVLAPVVAHAAAASCTHWAAPSGSGSSCTDSSPCTFSTWYGSKAGPGSVLCLKDGTYKGDTHILAFSAKSGSSSQLLTVRPFWFLGLPAIWLVHAWRGAV
jgi:hypothetical protein